VEEWQLENEFVFHRPNIPATDLFRVSDLYILVLPTFYASILIIMFSGRKPIVLAEMNNTALIVCFLSCTLICSIIIVVNIGMVVRDDFSFFSTILSGVGIMFMLFFWWYFVRPIALEWLKRRKNKH